MEPREVADRYTTIAEGLNARVAGCAATDWAASTPCPEWTVRDILEHVVGVHRVALALLDEAAAEPDAGEDAAGAWTTVTTAMRQVLRDPERATRIVSPRFGDMPFEDLVSRMVCSDTLVHTWDLARATGQDEHLDEHAVAVAWTWMQPAGETLPRVGRVRPRGRTAGRRRHPDEAALLPGPRRLTADRTAVRGQEGVAGAAPAGTWCGCRRRNTYAATPPSGMGSQKVSIR